jgi:starch phosphorylase
MEYPKNLFPGYHLRAITNGVHPYTWTCQPFRELFDTYIPGWANEPELLVRVDEIPYQKIWDAHIKAKILLINYINKSIDAEMGTNVLTLGFARRAGHTSVPHLFSRI